MKKKAIACTLMLMGILLAGCATAASRSMGQQMPVTGDTAVKSTQVMMATSVIMMGTAAAVQTGMMSATQQAMSTEAAAMASTAKAMMGGTPAGMMGAAPQAVGNMMAAQDWYNVGLMNAADDKKFSLADFKGKVVLVETMAIWCPTCLAQQEEVDALHKQLGANDEIISVSLDIDPHEQTADLKAYVAQNGFLWRYAVAPQSAARAIGNQFGAMFLNPPATPMFIIDREGNVHPLALGLKKADVLKSAVQSFLK